MFRLPSHENDNKYVKERGEKLEEQHEKQIGCREGLFGLHVHSYSHWQIPPSPHIWAHIRGRYWSAKKDDVFCDPLTTALHMRRQ